MHQNNSVRSSKLKAIRAVLLLFLFAGCTKQVGSIEGFDSKVWKEDRGGCTGKREKLAALLQKNQQEVKAVHERDLLKFLGRPDAQVLKEKNTKIYVYYLAAGEHCSEAWVKSPVKVPSIALHFNAVSLVTEVTSQIGNP